MHGLDYMLPGLHISSYWLFFKPFPAHILFARASNRDYRNVVSIYKNQNQIPATLEWNMDNWKEHWCLHETLLSGPTAKCVQFAWSSTVISVWRRRRVETGRRKGIVLSCCSLAHIFFILIRPCQWWCTAYARRMAGGGPQFALKALHTVLLSRAVPA